ncbi:MAG: hypothetical protein HS111_03035 [Kofleriaceae bacterium]|nr:hypothetical protein [Kofleriaceae bacterium]
MLLSIVVLAAVVGFFRYTRARPRVSHYKMVDEVMVGAGRLPSPVPIKVHGYVEAGEHRRAGHRPGAGARTFILEYRPASASRSATRAGARLVQGQVRGRGRRQGSSRRTASRILVATNLMAKCPSKYEGAPGDQLFD